MNIKSKSISNNQKGISLIITFFVMIVVLSLVLSISGILYIQIKGIRDAQNSVISYYAAESGVEKVLYYDRKIVQDEDTANACPQCDNGDTNCSQCDAGEVCKDIGKPVNHCVKPGAIRGLCWMVTAGPAGSPSRFNENYCAIDPNSSGSTIDSGIYCNAQTLMPSECNPDICSNCEVNFNTVFDGGAYHIKADTNGALNIKATGSYGNVSREINISVPNNP